MKIIHTSDWHLGDRLLEKSRREEFRAFLDWLLEQMQQRGVESLLVSGDIFDTRDPGAGALELFTDFLSRADSTGCRQVIMTAGNHDGAPVLEAARPLLERYHAVLVSRLNKDTAAECLVPLCGAGGEPEALVCAVPFLRPAEVSRAVGEEALAAGANPYPLGVQDVLEAVGEHARQWRAEHPGLPVLGMAHLTVCGAERSAAVQDIVVGSIEAVAQEAFPEVFDYVALGHIHKGYSPDGARLRYSGSPLPMGMDETSYTHHVLLLDVSPQGVSVEKIPVPIFTYHTKEVCSTAEELAALPGKLAELSAYHGGVPVHLELHYHGSGVDNLASWAAENLAPELVPHFKTSMWRPGSRVLDNTEVYGDTMPTPEEVFERKLAAYCEAGEELSEEEKQSLRALFTAVYTEAQKYEN